MGDGERVYGGKSIICVRSVAAVGAMSKRFGDWTQDGKCLSQRASRTRGNAFRYVSTPRKTSKNKPAEFTIQSAPALGFRPIVQAMHDVVASPLPFKPRARMSKKKRNVKSSRLPLALLQLLL